MISPLFSFFFLIFLSLLPAAYSHSKCQAIHAKAHGVEVICCSLSQPLIDTCEYSSICKEDDCHCQLIVDRQLACSLNSTSKEALFEWRDHSKSSQPLPCHSLNLPNPSSPYRVRIDHWNDNLTSSFMVGLCGTNVTSLVLHDVSSDISLIDLSKCLPHLKHLEITLKYQKPVDIYGSFRSLQNLRSLRIVNVDFEFWHSISPWVRSIAHIHIENSTLSEIPKWLAMGDQLTRLHLKNTRISSIGTISQLGGLRSAHLSHNGINDVHRHILSMKHVYDLDLSNNKIRSVATHSFSQCPQLRVLDLSDNPLPQLPYKPFLKNTRLKWLKLSGTQITILSGDHFVGLSSLKTLSLSRLPLQSIAPYALLPLKNLKSLDLQSSNLTRIPAAVTQNCGLTHLNLASNLLHRRSSLPPEVLVLLSSLSQFRIDGNPLTEFPSSLLLLSTDNHRLIRQLMLSMTSLPVWTAEPCTPYYWHMHVANKMKKEGMDYCREQYEWMIDQMDIYRELERNSGCSVSRRLRSAMLSQKNNNCNTTNITKTTATPFPRPVPSFPLASSVVLVSLAANFLFICLIVCFICMFFCCSRPKY